MLDSVRDVFKALNEPSQLINQPETEWLEFKQSPYQLSHKTKGKREAAHFELAKDVTAMANAGEGVIVIGVRTRKDPVTKQDLADRIRPIRTGSLNPDQILQVVSDWVIPQQIQLEVKSHGVPRSKGQLWTIYVARQPDRYRPFVVGREFLGRRSSRTLFSVYKRKGSQNLPVLPYHVQIWIHDGWIAAEGDLDTGKRVYEGVAPEADVVEEADRALRADIDAIGSNPRNCLYYIQAAPVSPARLERFHLGAAESLHERLRSLHHLRSGGFNLPDGFEPMLTDSGSLREIWLESDSLSVTPSGLTTAIQGQEPLTWAYRKMAPKGELWINIMALVEFTLEFWRFYAGEIWSRIADSAQTQWRAGMRALNLPGEELIVNLPAGLYPHSQRRAARADEFNLPWTLTDDTDPGRLAYETLKQVYAWFGFDHSLIPYSHDQAVSEDEILAVKRSG